MLYACYELIPLHVVMEISWRHNLNDYTMVSGLLDEVAKKRALTHYSRS